MTNFKKGQACPFLSLPAGWIQVMPCSIGRNPWVSQAALPTLVLHLEMHQSTGPFVTAV